VDGGTTLVVQSELSGVGQSLASLRSAGLDADVVVQQWIPFGPALSARTQWLERTGRLRRSGREEQKVVILADKQRAAPNDEQCGSWPADPCW
jgi:release factor glutamine methyltransferase